MPAAALTLTVPSFIASINSGVPFSSTTLALFTCETGTPNFLAASFWPAAVVGSFGPTSFFVCWFDAPFFKVAYPAAAISRSALERSRRLKLVWKLNSRGSSPSPSREPNLR